MDIQKYAVEEINKAGGILGRPVEYVVLDGKGDTSLSVEAARRLLMENKATFISIEGRSEICLAAQENSAAMFKEYPHILIFNGPMASELTAKVVDDYEKYKFCFRDWVPEPDHYSWLEGMMGGLFKGVIKGKKLAILWEDLAWTQMWRKGIDYLKLPSWEEVAKQKYGLEVVYSKPVKPRGNDVSSDFAGDRHQEGGHGLVCKLLVHRHGGFRQDVGRFGSPKYPRLFVWWGRPDA